MARMFPAFGGSDVSMLMSVGLQSGLGTTFTTTHGRTSEIENVIGELDGETETAVFAVRDEKFGEVPAAVVVASAKVTAARVFCHCRKRLAGFKRPRYVVVTGDPLPRKPSGKVDKQALRDLYSSSLHRHMDCASA